MTVVYPAHFTSDQISRSTLLANCFKGTIVPRQYARIFGCYICSGDLPTNRTTNRAACDIVEFGYVLIFYLLRDFFVVRRAK